MIVGYATPRPFGLVFGGAEIQLLKTKEYVEYQGIKVVLLDYFDLKWKVDLLHVFGSEYVLHQVVKLATGRGTPVITSSIYYPSEWWKQSAQKMLAVLPKTVYKMQSEILQMSSKVLPNSNAEANILKKIMKVLPEKVRVVPNGVSLSIKGTDPESFRRKYLNDLPKNERFILSVGRIEHRKNTINLVKAIQKLGIPLVLIGRINPFEKEYGYLFEKSIENSRSYVKRIDFIPPNSVDLANAYAAAHVHALVSYVETPGLANLEAAINGCNLVVGDSQPVQEYFNGVAEFVNPRKQKDIEKGIEDMINQPRNILKADKWVIANFSWERVAEKTVQAYKEVIS